MKKAVAGIISLLLLSGASMALAQAGDSSGNGGGGVVQQGHYMTFYSAGLYAGPANSEQAPFVLPVINDTLRYIEAIRYLGQDSKRALIQAIQPTTLRQYMIADPKLLTPDIKARLLDEFRRVTGVNTKKLVLYALTDTQQKVTYILPGFEKLSHDDQMSIIFHEAYWILHPDTTYQDVVHAEMAFEAALTRPDDASATYDFVSTVGNDDEILSAKLQWELAAGNLKGFVNDDGQFTLRQLLGDEYIACKKSQPPVTSIDETERFQANRNGPVDDNRIVWKDEVCAPYFRSHLNDLLAEYPKSMVLRDIAQSFDAGNPLLEIDFSGSTSRFEGKRKFMKEHRTLLESLLGGYSGYTFGCFGGATETSVAGSKDNLFDDNAAFRYDWDIDQMGNCLVDVSDNGINTSCPSYRFTAKVGDDPHMDGNDPSYIYEFQCSGGALKAHIQL